MRSTRSCADDAWRRRYSTPRSLYSMRSELRRFVPPASARALARPPWWSAAIAASSGCRSRGGTTTDARVETVRGASSFRSCASAGGDSSHA